VCAVLVPSCLFSHPTCTGTEEYGGQDCFCCIGRCSKICPLEGELWRQEETNTRLHGKDVDIFYSLSGLLFLFSDDMV
jgi:hypothetical protein